MHARPSMAGHDSYDVEACTNNARDISSKAPKHVYVRQKQPSRHDRILRVSCCDREYR